MKLSRPVTNFFRKQKIVIVSTIDDKGRIHCAVKGIADIDSAGHVFMIDFFSGRTMKNLEKRPCLSITAVDENKFIGYTLQGKAKIHSELEGYQNFIEKWQNFIVERISERIIASVRSGKKSKKIFESQFLASPKHLIEMKVENIIDLSPDQAKP